MEIDLSGFDSVCNKAFLPYIFDTNRFLVLYGGAGSGKSIFAAQKILLRLISEQGHRFLVTRKVAATLRNSCFALLRDMVYSWGLEDYFIFNKTSLDITFKPNKNIILFSGLDDVSKLKSIAGISGLWIEEASELYPHDLDQLNLRLRGETKHYKQIILTFNPINAYHWLKARFFDTNNNDVSILKTTYKDNRFIDDEYINELERLKIFNPSFYNIYALGEWGVIDGLIYPHYEVVKEMPTQNIRKHIYGVDFGYNDPTAVVEVILTDFECYVKELAYLREKTTHEIINYLNHNYPWLKSKIGYFEHSEPDRLKEFRKAGYIVRPAKKSIIDGINEVKRYALKVTEDSPNILKELNRYCWDKDKEGKNLDIPIDLDNHACDAIRYAVFSCGRVIAPFSYIEYGEGGHGW